MVIAFIGTRNPSHLHIDHVNLFTALARFAGQQGNEITTGAAEGMDQIAANATLRAGGTAHLYLPWRGFQSEFVKAAIREHGSRVVVHNLPTNPPDVWVQSVHDFHPAPYNLSKWAFCCHLRNYPIVEAADLVVALPEGKPGNGGTGQGMRIARSLNRTLWDLSRREIREQVYKQIRKLGVTGSF